MKVRIGINGFGRIGRSVFRAALDHPDVEVVAINGTADAYTLAHLVKYDSVAGTLRKEVKAKDGAIIIDGKEYPTTAGRDFDHLRWGDYGADIVLECTGKFRDKVNASKHFEHGAKKVIISAPAKDDDVTIVMGVNEDKYQPELHHVISGASCTTNCLAPVVKVLHEEFNLVNGLMTTVHSYTNDQPNLDKVHKDLRRARAAALSIIPTTTGAAKAVSLVLPELKGRLNGFSLRVPTPNVSLVDLVADFEKPVTKEVINEVLRAASEGKMKGIIGYTDEPLVSCDFNGDDRSAIVDALSTMTVGDHKAKVVAWYDNEWGYSCRLLDLAAYIGKKGY